MSAVAEALSTSGLAATTSKGRRRIRPRTVEYSCQVVSSGPGPGPTRRRSCSSRMSTRQDRSRKVCWSIVVPDRWHPKINTTWRSSGRARTIERAKRLTNASALRLNRGSSSRSLWRDGSSLGDAWATTSDCPLYAVLPCRPRERTRAPTESAAPMVRPTTKSIHRGRPDEAHRRSILLPVHAVADVHADPDLTRMTCRDRVRPRDLGGRPESPQVARRRPRTVAAMAHPAQRPVMPQ